MAKKTKTLSLSNTWEVYCQHPGRATPATVHEQKSYQATFNQFLRFIDNPQMTIRNIDTVIYYLGMYTGQCLKDCVLLRWDKLDFKLRKIWVKQFKTGKEVTIPMADALIPVLQEALKWETNEYI